MEQRPAIFYVRASTSESRQRNSHDMQIRAIEQFCERHNYKIVKGFCEYASGTLNSRPQFLAALQYAEENDVSIISYRCDRLSRRVSSFAAIEPHLHRIRFTNFGDQPLSLVVISILLSMAQEESRAISERVKSAYRTLKAKDSNYRWGAAISDETRQKGLEIRQRNASEFNSHIFSIVEDLESAGYKFSDIPARLNALQIFTRRGKMWKYHNLKRLTKQMEVRNG